MNYTITDIEGVGEAYGAKLQEAGIGMTEDLLEKCGAKKGREAIAAQTGLSEKLLLTWANMADMMRINGVGGQFAELLHGAGVDTVKELRTRNAENLAVKMAEVKDEKGITKAAPAASVVQGWIDQGKDMEPRITH